MDFAGKSAIVTGGSSGIGAALVGQLVDAGALVCSLDVNQAQFCSAVHITCDVSDEVALSCAIEEAETLHGPIDLYVSNAGVLSDQIKDAGSASNAAWERCWSVNVMAHVYAARSLIPAMRARGSGRFVIVASAAGLLNQIGDAAYSATKHAAVSFAESLAISHADDGIAISLACPQYVATPLIGLQSEAADEIASLLTADDVAQTILNAVKTGQFMVLPHPDVARYAMSRAQDADTWVAKMRALRRRTLEQFGDTRAERFYRMI